MALFPSHFVRGHRCLLLFSCVALSSCASLPWGVSPPAIAERSPAELQTWDLRADALARGETRGRASLHWRQQGEAFELTLSGPFGAGATRLSGTAERVLVQRGDTTRLSLNPAAELAEVTGALVPLERLADWLLGLPSRTAPPGQQSWSWGDWQVEIARRQSVGGVLLPEELQLSSPGQSLLLRRMRWDLLP